MEKDYINFIELAIQKGYIPYVTNENGGSNLYPSDNETLIELTFLQKWLREVKRIDIAINPHYMVGGGVAGYLWDITSPENTRITINKIQASGDSSTYELSVFNAIYKALELI
jgi:hypothetical protein